MKVEYVYFPASLLSGLHITLNPKGQFEQDVDHFHGPRNQNITESYNDNTHNHGNQLWI